MPSPFSPTAAHWRTPESHKGLIGIAKSLILQLRQQSSVSIRVLCGALRNVWALLPDRITSNSQSVFFWVFFFLSSLTFVNTKVRSVEVAGNLGCHFKSQNTWIKLFCFADRREQRGRCQRCFVGGTVRTGCESRWERAAVSVAGQRGQGRYYRMRPWRLLTESPDCRWCRRPCKSAGTPGGRGKGFRLDHFTWHLTSSFKHLQED